jgi:signal transduction histidine kinase
MARKFPSILKQLMPTPHSIRWRLFWFLGGVALGGIVAVNLVWLPATILEIKQSQRELQGVAVQSLRDQIRQFIGNIELDVRQAALQSYVSLLEEDKEALRTIGQRYIQHDPAFEQIGILDARGKEIFRVSRRLSVTDQELNDWSTTILFREGNRAQVYWGPLIISETSEPWVTVAISLTSSNPRSSGLLYAVLNLKWLWRMAGEFKLSKEGRAYIVDSSGRLIAAADPSWVLKQSLFADRPLIKELLFVKGSQAESLASGVYRNEEGIPVAATAVRLTPPGWVVIVEQSQSLLYAPIRAKIWFFIGLSFIGLLVSLILAHLASRKFTDPITRLRRGAEQIAAGHLDYRVSIETRDEIGQLAGQFNQMATALKESYRGLEDKIVERTNEISTLYAALTPLARSASSHQIFEKMIERIVAVTGADAALIRTFDEETGSFFLIAQWGFDSDYLGRNAILRSGSADEQVVRQREPIISENISADSRIKRKLQLEFGFNSCAFLPLMVKDDVRGVINLASQRLGYFTERKKEYLMTIARFMGIVIENSELLQSSVEYAEQLKQSNKELEQFAYVASHDLQEPLRMITGYTQLLARRYGGKLDQNADEYIGYAVDGAKRMQGLIRDLLVYSRVGTQGGELSPTDCKVMLQMALKDLRVAIEESGAVVSHDPLPTVMADDHQLGQLFQNLIGNGIKYRDSKAPEIHVSCQQEGRNWVFSVKDNGIGIDPQYAQQIFTIFQRLHTRQEYPGTGIGLAICKKIVERHGGKIWVESQLGKGATFYFSIPVMEEKVG